MATTVEQHSGSGNRSTSTDAARARYRNGRSSAVRWTLGLLLLVGLGGGTALALGWQGVPSWLSSAEAENVLTHTVSRGPLLISVTEDGNLQSARNIDVNCEIAGGSTILWIVEDGSQVQEGDVIVRLDPSTIEDQLNAQKITYNQAKAAKIQAEETYAAAKIAVDEYKEGTFKQQVQDLEAQITIAQENLSTARNMLAHTQRMFRKGFVTAQQLDADQFAVRRAELELDSAKTAKEVLEKYTYLKMLKELEAARDAAEAQMESQQASFELEESRLKKLEEQLAKCVIKAPQSGMVVYANDFGRRRDANDTQIQEGTSVREGQTIVRLPDLSEMQANVTVHESRVEQIESGMPARVTIQGKQYDGEVVRVANQPEPGSWFSSSVKEYMTHVAIAGASGLKPGMTAEVEIIVADLRDVVTVPVSAVVETRGKFYAWVQKPGGTEKRPVVLGRTNDKLIEVQYGLKEGEEVLLNPPVEDASAEEEQQGEAEQRRRSGRGRNTRRSGPQDGQSSGNEASGQSESSPGGQPNASGGNRRPAFNMSRFDGDGDGKISRDEAPAQMSSRFDQLDGNGDGFIDSAELAELRRRIAERRKQQQSERQQSGRPRGGEQE